MTKPTIGQATWGQTLNDHLDSLETPAGAQAKADAAQSAATAAAATDATTKADAAQAAAIAASEPLTVGGKRAVRKDELVLNVADYGIVGNAVGQDISALNAAINAVAGPVTIYFPKPSGSYYNLTTPLPNVNALGIRGDNVGTEVRWTSGSMLAPTTTLSQFRAENITLATTGSHLIELGTTGGLIHSSFYRAELRSRVDAASIIHMDGSGNFFNVHFTDCMLWRIPTATVAAIDLKCSASGCNTVSFRGGQWHSQLCNTAPFFRAETTSASSYVAGFSFRDIVGEQNIGGMIHMYGANRIRLENVIDFDGTTYADDLFKFATAASGPASYGVAFENSGTSATGTFTAGKYHLNIQSGGTAHDIGRIAAGGSQYGLISIPSTGRHVRHGGGRATSLRSTASSSAVTVADDIVIGTGASVTITLPDPTAVLSSGTVPTARGFTIKNTNASALTVVSAGSATIDGAASASLAQWASGRFVTDGTNWFKF